MNIVINVGREIEVHDICDIRDIQTTSCYIRCYHDGGMAASERLEGVLALTLTLISMNGACREALLAQDILDVVTRSFGFHEDEDETLLDGEEELHQVINLIPLVDILHSLLDILRSTSNPSHSEKDVIVEEIAGKTLDIWREGGREKHSLPLTSLRHTLLFHDTANLGFETHIKHAISLIKTEETDVLHGETTTFNEIDKTTRGSNQEIATTLDLTQLLPDIGTSINDNSGDTGAIGEFTRFFMDLRCEFASWCKDDGCGVNTTAGIRWWGISTFCEHGHDDWEKKSGCFS
mmetsp:Transcript_19392/g.28282  ORF Transcript_19392/g.28282 Transcript_19392/m.28282 type:complete len:292 (-) Transcript_19392:758-1633(-)